MSQFTCNICGCWWDEDGDDDDSQHEVDRTETCSTLCDDEANGYGDGYWNDTKDDS